MDYLANPPFLRTPMTDLANEFGRITLQKFGSEQCKRFEMKYLDCMDAYGIEKGSVKCSDAFEDFIECFRCPKQEWRYQQMLEQRRKLTKEGKLEKKYMDNPPPELIYPVKY